MSSAAARSVGGQVLPPVLLGAAGLAAWESFVQVRHIKPYLLPAPSAIGHEVVTYAPEIWSALLATGSNVVVGLVLGAVAAIVCAILVVRSKLLEEIGSPVAAALAVMPIVALAPVLNTMFTPTSTTPRRVLVAIVVFAPVFLNTVRGLHHVRPEHRDLMRAYAASPAQVTRTVTLPGAVPFVFTGLRIASSTAVISAVVAEYFGGLQTGLGTRITSAASNTAYARAWSYVLGAIVLGLAFYLVTVLLERWIGRRLGVRTE